MKLASLLAAAALLLPLASHAGVIYEWRARDDGTPRDIVLRLEFTQAAVDDGSFRFLLPFGDGASAYPDSGLLMLEYLIPGGPAMRYAPPTEKFRDGLGMLDIDLRFEADGHLSGRIHANNAESHFIMGSTGKIFTIYDANSDAGMDGAGCSWNMPGPCAGATGVLRDTRLAELPEPRSAGLMLAGALAAFGALRIRRRS